MQHERIRFRASGGRAHRRARCHRGDPCAVIGPDTRTELGVTATDPDTPIGASQYCDYDIAPGRYFQVVLAGDIAIDAFVGAYADGFDTTRTTIGGRAAVIGVETDGPAGCTVAVRVGPEATVGVVGRDTDATSTGPDDALCRAIRTAATVAMSDIVRQQ